MSTAPRLHWLPSIEDWKKRASALEKGTPDIQAAVALSNTQLDFIRTNHLDSLVRRHFSAASIEGCSTPVRLAILGSSTLAHLHAAVRIAGLRRRLWIDTYEGDYGQYLQELLDPGSGLHGFRPNAVLFAFDAYHLTQGLHSGLDTAAADEIIGQALHRIRQMWAKATDVFCCPILQQTVLNPFPPVLGNNEHRLPGSRHSAVRRLNTMLREASSIDNVDLIAIDDRAALDGLAAWHDPALWHRSKQEISPIAGPVYGDLVGRVLAARRGKSFKALVLDLDDTLWGGVIGDDGVAGIVLGQGSALGEGFVAVQAYAKELSRRGVILAVASKNDAAIAMEPFEKHPEMVLKCEDIASFRADWNDKAGNIRAIARELNISLDALVFVDDNPFERTLVRQELPMVAVPEVPDDPSLVPQVLADAGYFEATSLTTEDRERTRQYQANRGREMLKGTATNLDDYLKSLSMRMVWRPFDRVGLQRIVQLIGKTNQFNLTTRRHGEADVLAIMQDPAAFGLQIRLLDRFGDNGVIAIIIGRLVDPGGDVIIDTWLMSCRVLGRQLETATLNLIVSEARKLGATRIVGEYRPTAKNAMVRDHYSRLGFTLVADGEAGGTRSALDIRRFQPIVTFIVVEAGSG